MPLSTSGSLLLSSINSEFFPNDNPVNTFNWYNKMTYGTAQGYSPVISGSDPNVQIQMSNNTNSAGGFIYQGNTPIQNANQFVYTCQIYVANGVADYLNLYFGANSANTSYFAYNSYSGVTFNFQVWLNPGIYLYTNSVSSLPRGDINSNFVARSSNTVWNSSSWVNIMVVYQKGTIGTWNLYVNGVNVISYSDPNNAGWLTQAGDFWGWSIATGGGSFNGYLRQMNLSTNLPFSVVTPFNWYTNMIPVNYAHNFTPSQSGTDPNVQLQLSNGTSANNLQAAYVYNNFPVQNYGAFTLTFQFYLASGFNANGFYATFGYQSHVFSIDNTGNRYTIYFNTWAQNPIGGTGIYLLNHTHTTSSGFLTSAAVTWTTNAWNTVVINYTRNTTETWKVSYNGVNYITYADTFNQRWVNELAGNYWAIGSSSNVQSFWIRQVNMVVTPSSGGNSQKLVTPLNWYTRMTFSQIGGNNFTPVQAGADPNVQIQVCTSNYLNNGVNYYSTLNMNIVSSFAFQCEYYLNGGSDNISIFFGSTNTTASPIGSHFTNSFTFMITPNSDYPSGAGLYIYNSSTQVAYLAINVIANSWIPLNIVYTKGTVGTWVINHNGTYLNYSDTSNTSWITNSGTFWGLGGKSGGNLTLNAFFRKVQMSYTPTSTLNFSSLSGIAPGVGNTGGSTGISYSQLRGKTGTSSGLNSTNVMATDQGSFNSNTTYISSFTTDTSARMIQIYGQAIGGGNTANARHIIQQTYTNIGNSVINATMTMSCQNVCKVYQNKVLIYPDFQVDASNFTFQVILDIGVNLFEFVCWKNNNTLGGFIYTLINNSGNAVLMRSDNVSTTALTNTSKITVTSSPAQLGPLDYIPSIHNVSGAYGLVKLKAFPGSNLPVVQVRRSSDNATRDIFADWQGNLINSDRTSLANWLNGATAFVTIWYDQSGSGNNATQPTNINQPVLTWNTSQNAWCVDTTAATSQRLLIPSNTVPVGTANAPYTFVFRHGLWNATTGGVIGAGTGAGNQANSVRAGSDGGVGYYNYWFFNDFSLGSNSARVAGNTVAIVYDGTNQNGYINGILTQTNSGRTGATTVAGQQYLFSDIVNSYMNGQLYYFYIIKNALSTPIGGSVNNILETSSLVTLNNTITYTLPLPNPCLNQVPVLDSISITTKAGCRGAYALVRLSMSYTGATINLRRGFDNTTSDFYADVHGNLNTAINNTGTTLTNWLRGTIGYVAIWYDQSGNGNNATQATNNLQPVISPFTRFTASDVNWLVDTQTSSTQFMNIPSNTVPVGTLNAPYSFVFRHQTINNQGGVFIGAGTTSTNRSNVVRGNGDESNAYINYWWSNDLRFGTNSQRVSGNQVAITYNGSTHTGYINTTSINTATRTGGTTDSGQQYLFRSASGEYLNGQLFYMYIFNTAIPDIDRLKLMTI